MTVAAPGVGGAVRGEWAAQRIRADGRNGLHRYNNSDHSMLTAMRAVENLAGARHDVWGVNADPGITRRSIPTSSPMASGSASSPRRRALAGYARSTRIRSSRPSMVVESPALAPS
jgi:hypothetical protein